MELGSGVREPSHARGVAVAAAENSKTEYQINAGDFMKQRCRNPRVDGGRSDVIDCQEIILYKSLTQLVEHCKG